MTRVGLLLQLRGMWRGGVVYYNNLLECYQDHPDPDVQLEVFTDQPRGPGEIPMRQSACPPGVLNFCQAGYGTGRGENYEGGSKHASATTPCC